MDKLTYNVELTVPRVTAREMDAFLSTGEQLSAGLLAMAIQAMGYPVITLTGWQAGIRTDNIYGNARILGLENDRILQELDRGDRKSVV